MLALLCQHNFRLFNVLTTSDKQTEDGHAMMESDTFHSFQDFEPRSAWMSQLCAVSESGMEKENTLDSSQQMCANITARVHTSPKRPTGKWYVDCEGAVVGCR